MGGLALLVLRRLGGKIALIAVSAALAVGGYALFWSVAGVWQAEQERAARRLETGAELAAVRARLVTLEGELEQVRAALETARRRLETAQALQGRLAALHTWWERLWMTAAERAEWESRAERARFHGAAAEAALRELTGPWAAAEAEFQRLLSDRAALEARLAALAAPVSPALAAVLDAWTHLRGALLLAALGILFGPTAWKLFLFHGPGAWAEGSRPLRLRPGSGPDPQPGSAGVSVGLRVREGERAFVRVSCAQASDESLERGARHLLDRRLPLTSIVARLYGLIEFRAPPGSEGGVVTVSSGTDEALEFSEIIVPAESSLVLRPRHLAAIVLPVAGRLQVRRHWVLGHRVAWLVGQLRLLEFVGPCRVVLSGRRGLRTELLAPREAGAPVPVKRVNADATVAFSPRLAWGSRRAESVWIYLWGTHPLFDDVFAGTGLLLCEEVVRKGPAAASRSFWSGLWGGLTRVLGW